MINQDRMVNTFIDYVKISSPTKQEGRFAKYLVGELEALGCQVHIDDAGEKVGSDTGNIRAFLKGTHPGTSIILSAHMDTVSPSIDIKPIIKDGTIFSDGTTVLGGDDKAGITAIIEALRVLKEDNIPHADIEIAFSIFEEGGLHGAKNLDFSTFTASSAFVFDSGGDPGEIVIKGPAQDKLYITLTGIPAHAGVSPENGVSAVMIAAEAIHNMKLLRIDEETTANIGTISGGSATNIVMPEVTIEAESRSLDNTKLAVQSQHMKKCFEDAAEKFGGKADVEIKRMYDAFSVDETDPITQVMIEVMTKLGLSPHLKATGGGSDTNVYNANGIKAVNLGIGERKPHTKEEHLHIKDLVSAGQIALEIIKAHTA